MKLLLTAALLALAAMLALTACGSSPSDEALERGSSYLDAGLYEMAIGQFTKAISLDPHHVADQLGVTMVRHGALQWFVDAR